MNSKEEWKEINGFPNYRISNLGNVYNINSNEYIKPFNNNGYKRVNLYYNRKQKSIYVHRLVAEAFLDNFNNCRVINHKDEDKTNNCVNNLEWCTHKYNTNYGNCINKIKSKSIKRPVVQLTLDNKIINEYNSTIDAYKKTKISNITRCCKSLTKTAGNYVWRYKDEI